jgi:transcriptional regulator GlxA family with amidase domain
MATDVEILLFDGFDELDAVGPYEVFDNGARRGADLNVSLVTLEPEEMILASHGLKVVPDGQLGRPDLLVVPGGGWSDGGGVRDVVADGRLPRAVADRHGDGATVASVCTGAMILAEAGLLDGRPATTHHVAHEDLDAVADRVDARVVDDGDVVTAGGVTSGIDLALYLLEREFGADVAAGVARELEHDRRGPVHVADD